MTDPNHTSRTLKIDLRLPHDLVKRLDVLAVAGETRTSVVIAALRVGLPIVEARGLPKRKVEPVVPAWVERWRGSFGVVSNAEIARTEGVSGAVVGKWRGRVERGEV